MTSYAALMSHVDDSLESDGARLVVRIWLPDRPGALGLVASRIGALGADIVGIDVLERSEHVAVDEFAVVLPSDDLVALLVREIGEVDGASVEEWQLVDRFPDPRLDALETVEQLMHATVPTDLGVRLAKGSAASSTRTGASCSGTPTCSRPSVPTSRTLPCSRHSPPGPPRHLLSPRVKPAPTTSPIAPLEAIGAILLVGRDGHPFRRRERQQLLALARIADRIADARHVNGPRRDYLRL